MDILFVPYLQLFYPFKTIPKFKVYRNKAVFSFSPSRRNTNTCRALGQPVGGSSLLTLMKGVSGPSDVGCWRTGMFVSYPKSLYWSLNPRRDGIRWCICELVGFRWGQGDEALSRIHVSIRGREPELVHSPLCEDTCKGIHLHVRKRPPPDQIYQHLDHELPHQNCENKYLCYGYQSVL